MASDPRSQKERLADWEDHWGRAGALQSVARREPTATSTPVAARPPAKERPRGDLVLVPRPGDPALAPRDPDRDEPGRVEGDRIVAESQRYRLAVVRQARRRLLDGRHGRT